ncbi:hypothetical protein F5878DRAFT_207207 [Lentinula raphanica]|uniref:Uncharacterized protein n=1 Tax=Lentinula raphanica TaxID=153919 RepID=A0AA38PMR2_9AGAR|nr:hypothetical protein F5878DRAFT_207207 [Lentinula raphanica]
MRIHPLLPNELLHSIVEYIAYAPLLPKSPFQPNLYHTFPFKYASRELLALSVANWHLRRVCLPFLFAYIKIRDEEDATKLQKYLGLLSEFTTFLFIGDALTMKGDEAISENLPQLKQLSHVELEPSSDCGRTVLLRTSLAHPNVTSVLVHDVPDGSIWDEDLSKLILQWMPWDPYIRKCLERGMKLMYLDFYYSFDIQLFQNEKFCGLKEIRISISDAVSSLSMLLSAIPTLDKLWLTDDYGYHFGAHTSLCMTSSISKTFQWQSLSDFGMIQRIGLCQCSQEWTVNEITTSIRTFDASRSLPATLISVASAFPKTEKLNLHLPLRLPQTSENLNVKNFASVFAPFSSLRRLSLCGIYNQLVFTSNKSLPPIPRIDSNALRLLEPEIVVLWYPAWVAKEVRSLDAIYINEEGWHQLEYSSARKFWSLKGWLHVVNGNRDIGGTLRRFEHKAMASYRFEVLLETSMFSSFVDF